MLSAEECPDFLCVYNVEYGEGDTSEDHDDQEQNGLPFFLDDSS